MKREHPEIHWVLLNNKCDIYCYVDWLALLEHSSDGRSCGKSFVPKMVRQGMTESRQPGHDKATLGWFGVQGSGFCRFSLSLCCQAYKEEVGPSGEDGDLQYEREDGGHTGESPEVVGARAALSGALRVGWAARCLLH